MSSDRTGSSPGHRSHRSRVIKSHQVAGMAYAFPALEQQQVAAGDLPVSRIADFVLDFDTDGADGTPGLAPAPAPAVLATVQPPTPASAPAPLAEEKAEIRRLMAEAREAEARARAVERRAAAVLEEAEEAAARRVAEADEVIARAQEAGFAAGHEEGLAAGLAEGQVAAESLLAGARSGAETIRAEAEAAAEAMLQEGMAQRAELLASAAEPLVDLALAVARQVLKAELSLRPEAVLPMVEAALAKLKGEEEVHIRVSPDLLALLEEQRGRLLAALPGARRIGIEADAALLRGDFTVQGAQGFVDGRLEKQVQTLRSALEEEER